MNALPDFIYLASQSPRRRQLLDQIGVRFELLLPGADEDAEALEQEQAGELPAAYVERVTRAKLAAALERLGRAGLPPAPILCADTTVALGRRIFGKPRDAADAIATLQQLSGRTHRVITAVAMAVPVPELMPMPRPMRAGLAGAAERETVGPSADRVPAAEAAARARVAEGAQREAAVARFDNPNLAGAAVFPLVVESMGYPKVSEAARGPEVVPPAACRWVAVSHSRVRFGSLPAAAIAAYVESGEPFGKAGAYAIQGAAAAWIARIDGSYSGIMGLPLFETAQLLRHAGAIR